MITVPLSVSPRRRLAITVLVGVAMLVIMVADVFGGDRLAVWKLALAPVALLAWTTSIRRASAVVVVAMMIWLSLTVLFAPPAPPSALWFVDVGLRAGAMVFVVVLAGGWRRSVVRSQEAARVDVQTGLVTPREFFRVVDAELQRAMRYERPFTVVYVALHGSVDSGRGRAGHGRGRNGSTELLKMAGAVVIHAMRIMDTVALLPSGELAVLMPETGPAAAQVALDRMRTAMDVELGLTGVAPTLSVGAVTWIETEITVDQLLQRVYQMLYAAQKNRADPFRHEVLDTADVLL